MAGKVQLREIVREINTNNAVRDCTRDHTKNSGNITGDGQGPEYDLGGLSSFFNHEQSSAGASYHSCSFHPMAYQHQMEDIMKCMQLFI